MRLTRGHVHVDRCTAMLHQPVARPSPQIPRRLLVVGLAESVRRGRRSWRGDRGKRWNYFVSAVSGRNEHTEQVSSPVSSVCAECQAIPRCCLPDAVLPSGLVDVTEDNGPALLRLGTLAALLPSPQPFESSPPLIMAGESFRFAFNMALRPQSIGEQ